MLSEVPDWVRSLRGEKVLKKAVWGATGRTWELVVLTGLGLSPSLTSRAGLVWTLHTSLFFSPVSPSVNRHSSYPVGLLCKLGHVCQVSPVVAGT